MVVTLQPYKTNIKAMKSQLKYVKYTVTSSSQEVSGCIPNVWESTNGQSLCSTDVNVTVFPGDTLYYSVEATAHPLATSKYLVSGILMVENTSKEAIIIEAMRVKNVNWGLVPAKEDDSYIIPVGAICAYSFDGRLVKTEQSTLEFEYTLQLKDLSDFKAMHILSEPLSMPENSDIEPNWLVSLQDEMGTPITEPNFVELSKEQITIGSISDQGLMIPGDPIKKKYLAKVQTVGGAVTDSEHLNINVSALQLNFEATINNYSYVSNVWKASSSSKVHRTSPASLKCSRGPLYWSNHMNIAQNDTSVCSKCDFLPTEAGMVWPEYNAANPGDYYKYSNGGEYYTPSQLCIVLKDFAGCLPIAKPSSGSTMASFFSTIKALTVCRFNLYNGISVGSCSEINVTIVDLLTQITNFVKMITENIKCAKTAQSNLFSLRTINSDPEASGIRVLSLTDAKLQTFGINQNKLIEFKTYFKTKTTLLEAFYRALSPFNDCGFKYCADGIVDLKDNKDLNPCTENQIVSTLDLNLTENIHKRSILHLSINSMEISYEKNITVTFYYKDNYEAKDIFKLAYSSTQSWELEIPATSIENLDYIEFWGYSSIKDLSSFVNNVNMEDKVVLGRTKPQIKNIPCVMMTTNSLSIELTSAVTVLPCQKAFIKFPISDVDLDVCDAFLAENSYIIAYGPGVEEKKFFYCSLDRKAKEILTKMVNNSFDINSELESLINDTNVCGFLGYNSFRIQYVISIAECVGEVNSLVTIKNAIKNEGESVIQLADKVVFGPSKDKLKISDQKQANCISCGVKTKEEQTKRVIHKK